VTSPYGRAVVIMNSRAGRSPSEKDRIKDLIASTGLDHNLRMTEHRGHAVELARQAVSEGCRYLVAVGGDGTIHEVVNGMMGDEGPVDPATVLAVVPGGSGSDFIRTFGLPADPADAVKHLLGDPYFQVDVGKVTFTTEEGMRSVYFPNIAEAGLGGEVVRRAEALPRRIGKLRYLLSFWMTLARFKSATGVIHLDHRTYEGRVTNLVVANGQFFGGGMRIAPKAHPADGKFDVLVQKGNKRDYVAGITKVFKGEHLPSPAIKEYHARHVEITTDRPLQVEADGEVLGTTPATFEIIEDAFRLKL